MYRMTIQIVERPPLTVVGLQIRTKPMSSDIPALWPRFVARIPEIGHLLEPDVSYGVMEHDTGAAAVLKYMAAVSVEGLDPLPEGMTRLILPAGTYAAFRYPLSGLTQGFCEIFERLLPASDFAQIPGPYFERYDQSFDPSDANSKVDICLPVRRR
jgi:AraC family transcriptional regulator